MDFHLQQQLIQPPGMIATPQPGGFIRVRALFKYDAQNPDDLSFEKGESMLVEPHLSESWWQAVRQKTGEKGYIPSNFFVVDNDTPFNLDAWHNITRYEADGQLLLMGNKKGTYLIRPSSDKSHLALSVRHYDGDRKMYVVKHYKLREIDGHQGYYISPRLLFQTIQELINHYRQHADGLCCTLTVPCPRTYRPPVQFRDIEVNRDSIALVKPLGAGSFGEVFLATWNKSLEVAVKRRRDTANADLFLQEAKMMHKLHHPRIVQLLGVCTEPPDQPLYIITELMHKGALGDFLRGAEGKRLQLSDLIDIIRQIAEGMAYLEAMNSVHRDLRSANILVDKFNSVKVADFGLAKMLTDSGQTDSVTKFPIKWTAPEAANPPHTFSIKSDVWSFGVLLYEIITYGGTPYESMSNRLVLTEIANGYRMSNPHTTQKPCPVDLYMIMIDTWNESPDKRPTFSSLQDIFQQWDCITEQQYIDDDFRA